MPPTDSNGLLLPDAVEMFVRALNDGDVAAVVGSFAEHALVNDELQEYWNRRAIGEWASGQVCQRLSMGVRGVVRNGDHTVVTAAVDGTFDKRGLPNPLVLTFYFSCHAGKIVQLLILRNEPALPSPAREA
jgi:hypothetical protein